MAYRIGIVVADQEEADIICNEVFPEEVRHRELLVRVSSPNRILADARSLVGDGAQALIARGGNYHELEQAFDEVPLVELSVLAQDVLSTLGGLAGRYDTVWLVLSVYARFDYEGCRGILPSNVHYYSYSPVKEMLDFIAALPTDRKTLIIGGGYVVAPARERGLDVLQIHSSPAILRESYLGARRILQAQEAEKMKSDRIAAILSNIEDGVVALDHAGCVMLCNRKAEELLECSAAGLRGRELAELLPAFAPFRGAWRLNQTDERLVRLGIHALMVRSVPLVRDVEGETVTDTLLTMRDVTRLQELERNLRFQLTKKGMVARYHFEDILTREDTMRAQIDWARRCADSDNTVMIYGESGTGKELFAQSIHNASSRRDYPFVAVNCAALTENLLESELFGYASGAFTGARKEGKAGLFELAHRGTIFLDEINSMSLNTQAKILRVIEQREVMRLGDDRIIPLDVRIITAANENLVRMVRKGEFRRDLFFRLNVLEIHIPTLNERPEDVLFLFRRFVAELEGKEPEAVALRPEMERALREHNWWGNVRELRNAAQRYVVRSDPAEPEALFPPELTEGERPLLVDEDTRLDLKELNRTVEALVIQSLLGRGLTKTQTAKVLGISRTALFKKLEQQKDGESTINN